jgi:ribosomal protein S18 acetylase RimI-like enzyme
MNIFQARSTDAIREAQLLFREYETSLGIDLAFQNFSEEARDLPGNYTPPHGALLLARAGRHIAGCAAMRAFREGSCEMKRLYVRPGYRGKGIGSGLARKIISRACAAGYGAMYLDTLSTLEAALSLYRSLGFREVEPYYLNPLPGVVYMRLELAP